MIQYFLSDLADTLRLIVVILGGSLYVRYITCFRSYEAQRCGTQTLF